MHIIILYYMVVGFECGTLWERKGNSRDLPVGIHKDVPRRIRTIRFSF